MQRLFSTFPEGWPGTGLLFLRVACAIPALESGMKGLTSTPLAGHLLLKVMVAGAAALLLSGFWTPVAGLLFAAIEIGLAFSHPYDPWLHILLAALGAALAMLGPGAWSVDARLFGRKRIRIPQR